MGTHEVDKLQVNESVTVGKAEAIDALVRFYTGATLKYQIGWDESQSAFVISGDTLGTNDFIKITATEIIFDNRPILIKNIKSGATQAGAGAAADEVWKTSGHATLPDNVLMIGV